MAVNESRSRNLELAEGLTERKYKSSHPDRGGVLDPATEHNRRHLDENHYGYLSGMPVDARVLPDDLA